MESDEREMQDQKHPPKGKNEREENLLVALTDWIRMKSR